MKKISIAILLMLLSCIFSVSAEVRCDLPSGNAWFSICIEQDGEVVPSSGGIVEIEKKPFTLVIIMKEPIGVLVNFSSDERLHNGFRQGQSIEDLLKSPEMFMGMAEELFNPEEKIIIDNTSPHYLFYEDESQHRFSTVEMKEGYIFCRRKISNITTFNLNLDPVPLQRLPGNDLFLSFLYSEYDEDWNRIEKQKEALHIHFY